MLLLVGWYPVLLGGWYPLLLAYEALTLALYG